MSSLWFAAAWVTFKRKVKSQEKIKHLSRKWRIWATRMNWLMTILRVQFCYELDIVDPLADLNGNRCCCFVRVSHSHLKSCLYTQEEVWTDNKHAISFILLAIILCVTMHWEKYSALSQDRHLTRKQNLAAPKWWLSDDQTSDVISRQLWPPQNAIITWPPFIFYI